MQVIRRLVFLQIKEDFGPTILFVVQNDESICFPKATKKKNILFPSIIKMGYSSGARRSITSAPSTGHAADQGLYGYAGGSAKKQGLPKGVGHFHDVIRFMKSKAEGTARSRQTVFAVNMLGGVGAGRSQFRTANTYANPDGVRRFDPYYFWDSYPTRMNA